MRKLIIGLVLSVVLFWGGKGLAQDVSPDLTPQIWLNNMHEAKVNINQPFTISVALDGPQYVGMDAYWYLVEVGPTGIRTFKVDNWQWSPGFDWNAPSFHNPIFNFSKVDLFSIIHQLPGRYEYYFGLVVFSGYNFVVYDYAVVDVVKPTVINDNTENNDNNEPETIPYICVELKSSSSVYVYLDDNGCPSNYREVDLRNVQDPEMLFRTLLSEGAIKANLASAKDPQSLVQCLNRFLPAEITVENKDAYAASLNTCAQYW